MKTLSGEMKSASALPQAAAVRKSTLPSSCRDKLLWPLQRRRSFLERCLLQQPRDDHLRPEMKTTICSDLSRREPFSNQPMGLSVCVCVCVMICACSGEQRPPVRALVKVRRDLQRTSRYSGCLSWPIELLAVQRYWPA